ncbi:MAG: hypothetical protein ACLTTJ_14115 [Blautia sp.]
MSRTEEAQCTDRSRAWQKKKRNCSCSAARLKGQGNMLRWMADKINIYANIGSVGDIGYVTGE